MQPRWPDLIRVGVALAESCPACAGTRRVLPALQASRLPLTNRERADISLPDLDLFLRLAKLPAGIAVTAEAEIERSNITVGGWSVCLAAARGRRGGLRPNDPGQRRRPALQAVACGSEGQPPTMRLRPARLAR